jgi:rare lipoprotein A
MKKLIAFFLFISEITVFVAAQMGPPENGGFRQEGVASWYGEEFEGRQTASGDIFDPKQFTAAHPTLPFGTVLTVTNLANNNQVQVRVNDRGPFVSSRIIDVSKVAAEKLDMLITGTAKVVIEVAPRSFSPIAKEEDTAIETNSSENVAKTEVVPQTGATVAKSSNTERPVQPVVSASVAEKERLNLPASPNDVRTPVYSPTPPPNPPRPSVVPASPRVPAPQIPQTASVPQTSAAQTPTTPQKPAASQTSTGTTNKGEAAVPTQIRPVQNPNTWRPAVSAPPPVSNTSPPKTTAPQPEPNKTAAQRPVPAPATETKPSDTSNQGKLSAPATILGGPIVQGRIYRIQVGSFREASNAMKAYNKLTAAGFNPQWERHENMFRVVLTGVKTEEIPVVATKLGEAGFKEAVARLEGIDIAE